ncbi:MAG: ABC transporter ATP-binding protein [Rhizobiales bacterium]|nr:ABC transporter ATP-binding protein [Hyphomicrobiales bacterium]
MLEVEALQSGYGPNPVLFGVDFAIREGEVVTLLGRNGMGKTTSVKTILGLVAPCAGRVRVRGRDVTGLAPEKIARLGIGLVPEGRQVFPTLTVRENLVATAANRLNRANPWTLARIHALFPRLRERENQSAKTLSGGEQQMLSIGRALMTNPALLILDEATEGLAPVIRDEIWSCLRLLKSEGLSILLIDKNLSALSRFADRHVILEKGRSVWQGDGEALKREEARVHALIGL